MKYGIENYSFPRLSSIPSSPITLAGVLGTTFITLKLIGSIDWSWTWVTLPLWYTIPLNTLLFCIGALLQWRNNANTEKARIARIVGKNRRINKSPRPNPTR